MIDKWNEYLIIIIKINYLIIIILIQQILLFQTFTSTDNIRVKKINEIK